MRDRQTAELDPTGASAPLELSVVIPCLNEAETLAVCIDKARAFIERRGIAGEVVVGDNGARPAPG